MVPTKAQESIAIRIILFPHRFQGGIPIGVAPAKAALDRRAAFIGFIGRARIADPDATIPTGLASTLVSVSVAKDRTD
jgi:hypothetical protein